MKLKKGNVYTVSCKRLFEYECVRATKKEAILIDKRGRSLRITPSEFRWYHENPLVVLSNEVRRRRRVVIGIEKRMKEERLVIEELSRQIKIFNGEVVGKRRIEA